MTELYGMSKGRWESDPKLLGITLARYKFVGRMLEGYGSVLEVGCNDGLGSRVVKQHVGDLVAVDVSPRMVEEARRGSSKAWPIHFACHDILEKPLPGFDAVYCLDVFEHIADEERLLTNLRDCAPVVIIGIPSLESQRYATSFTRADAYASADSLSPHVNCKSGADFKASLKKHWKHVFLFSMNDEVIHTGFYPMAHYLIAVCV